MMQQPVEHGAGERGIAVERFLPVAERQVRGQDHRALLVAFGDHQEEHVGLFNEKLHEWEDYYNYHRPHGALQGRTTHERLIEKSRAFVSQGS